MSEAFVARFRVWDPVLKYRPKIVTIRRPGRAPYQSLANDPRTNAFEAEVRMRARSMMAGRRILSEPLELNFRFGLHADQRGDIDNWLKSGIDSLVGAVMQDDAQVREIHARRETVHKAQRPWVEITVRYFQEKKPSEEVGNTSEGWPKKVGAGS